MINGGAVDNSNGKGERMIDWTRKFWRDLAEMHRWNIEAIDRFQRERKARAARLEYERGAWSRAASVVFLSEVQRLGLR